jgi:hypothetical protein
LRAGNTAAAVARYREALPLLKTAGHYADAEILHALGASAFAANSAEAAAAKSAADAAHTRLVADAPSTARSTLEAELARRLRELQGAPRG